jgi:lysophospholipase L1-like esterase
MVEPELPQKPTVKPWKTWLGKLSLLGGSALGTLLLVEFVLHAIGYPPNTTNHTRLFLEHDSLRGWRNVAGVEAMYATPEYSVLLTYNARGIRGAEIPYQRTNDTYRVLILGDSFVDGYGVELEDRVSEVLQRLLREAQPTRAIEVLALGAAGYSTDQELIWLETEGLRYEPNLVVLLFYANDIWYNAQPDYWRGSKPFFVGRDGSLALSNVPVPEPNLDDEEDADGSVVGLLRGWAEKHSQLGRLAGLTLRGYPRVRAWAVRLGLAGLTPEMILDAEDQALVPAEFTVFWDPLTPEAAHALDLTEQLLDRMRQSVEGAGGRFAVFHVPFRGSVYTEESSIRGQFGLSAEGPNALAVARWLEEVCLRRELTCLEPLDQFMRAARSLATDGERLYYQHDWHWNANGHRLAAEILAAHVLANGLSEVDGRAERPD